MTTKTLTDKCQLGNCAYSITVNGEKIISPESFSCKYSFWNPQYPVYVSCRKLKLNEGDFCLCPEFREERRKLVRENNIPMQRYIEILKQRTLSAPLI